MSRGHARSRPLLVFAAVLTLVAGRARADDDPWLARDKALHFSACTLLSAGGYGASALWLQEPYQRALTGAGFAVAVGALKEGVDALGYGDPSWRDFTWDVAGAAVGTGLALGLDYLVNSLRSRHKRAAGEGLRFHF